jgi:hypothetical protein
LFYSDIRFPYVRFSFGISADYAQALAQAEATSTADLTRGGASLIADRLSVTGRKRIFDPEFSNGCVWIEV